MRRRSQRRQGGFTLIEVLVALAVASTVLAAIGLVVGSNLRATRALERRAALLQTARAVEAGIPPRANLKDGRLDGAVGNHIWRMDVRPMEVGDVPAAPPWLPRHILIRIQDQSGAMVEIETIRLVPGAVSKDAASKDATGAPKAAGEKGQTGDAP